MSCVQVNLRPSSFTETPFEVVNSGALKATAFVYETGISALKVESDRVSLVVLPYTGMQIWFPEFDGKQLGQKSMFEMPQNTQKFGDTYGGFLYHCGLNNINGPADGEDPYPMHDVLPFAVFKDVRVTCGVDEHGNYIAASGSYVFRNSQELHWVYSPELKMYEGEAMVEMSATIENRRCRPLEYLWMCHMNWLGVEGSKFVYSCPVDREHVQVVPTELGDDSERAVAIREYSKRLCKDPTIADVLDSKTQVYDPELCINYRYLADEAGWAHAMQVMPSGDACYVGWDTTYAPYALRWFCRTGDEDGVGIALPSTGTCHSTTYQRHCGHFNTLATGETHKLSWRFGYLKESEAAQMAQKINDILAG